MDEQERDARAEARPGVPAGTPEAVAEDVAAKRRCRYSVAEKLALLDEFAEAGERVRDFCARRGASTASLCKWRRQHEADGEAGLAPRPNPRNRTGRTGRRATFAERKAAVEAYLKAGATLEQFAHTWGRSKQTLSSWLKLYLRHGPQGLMPRRAGRRPSGVRCSPSGVGREILRIKQRFPLFGLCKVRDYLFRFVGLRVSKSHVRSTLADAGVP